LGNKIAFNITRETLKKIHIDPEIAIEHLEHKEIKKLTPIHVMAHQLLKQTPVVPSS
jgi:hypothetical protein